MKEAIDKFTIEVSNRGLRIVDHEGTTINFAPGEALMLLDALRQEEEYLKAMAKADSPLPIRIKV